ncbi:MAG TPA: Trm112 family protein [Anaeromyxobacter sp.]|nr:Trm112 family protein [Anaeromyxobacter sp.]
MTGEGKARAPLAPELKEILACPRCKGGLEFREAEGEIRCLACRLAFRIDDGIPVMLLDEARAI